MSEKPKRRAVAMVVEAAAGPAPCPDCAAKDARLAALSARLDEVQRSLAALQRIRG